MKSNTSLKKGDEVLWFGVDLEGNSDLVYGSITGIETLYNMKFFHAQEKRGLRSFTTRNPFNLTKVREVMKSHEIRYIR